MVVVSLALSGHQVQEAFLLARAKKMRDQARWEEAFQAYQQLVSHHHDTETLLTYAEMAVSSSHWEEASDTLTALHDRRVSQTQMNRARSVEYALSRSQPARPVQPTSQPAFTPASPIGDLSNFHLDPLPSRTTP